MTAKTTAKEGRIGTQRVFVFGDTIIVPEKLTSKEWVKRESELGLFAADSFELLRSQAINPPLHALLVKQVVRVSPEGPISDGVSLYLTVGSRGDVTSGRSPDEYLASPPHRRGKSVAGLSHSTFVTVGVSGFDSEGERVGVHHDYVADLPAWAAFRTDLSLVTHLRRLAPEVYELPSPLTKPPSK